MWSCSRRRSGWAVDLLYCPVPAVRAGRLHSPGSPPLSPLLSDMSCSIPWCRTSPCTGGRQQPVGIPIGKGLRKRLVILI